MAFDACFIAAVVHELNENICNARVEKIQQPEKDEIVFILHRERESIKLSVSAGANNPRINITSIIKENPKAAPMFCMLLRKYLTGAKITSVVSWDSNER
jgi:predicted ribosome quality control (RQC) complex YloA/Tae2 family protein